MAGMADSALSVSRRYGASRCSALRTAVGLGIAAPRAQSNTAALRYWTQLHREEPLSSTISAQYATALLASGDTIRAEAVVNQPAPWEMWEERRQRVQILASIARAQGDPARAQALIAALDAAEGRDRRPAVRLMHLDQIAMASGRPAFADSLARAALGIAVRHRAWTHASFLCRAAGTRLMDAGKPASAVSWLRLAVAYADSARAVPLGVSARTALGRAYAKTGRWSDAIDILRRTVAMADQEDIYAFADIYHNLAHAFEGAGRMDEAVRAIDRFARLAAPLRSQGISVISLYDAGIIRWKVGLHAAAREAFDAMVRIVDERQAYQYYAGEYYERVGDLPAALRYYRAVPRGDTEEGARALGGLTRVYEALGMRDSAEAVARAHDAAPVTPEEVPLVPRLLAARGRSQESLRLSRAWTERQIAQGNVAGAVRAKLELAQLVLDHGSPGDALAEAQRAESLATKGNFVEEIIRARTIVGLAYLKLGRTREAQAMLSAASRWASALSTGETALQTSFALGQALAVDQPVAALEAYDAAARVVERMAEPITEGLDRARFHARQLAPFNAALRLLLRQPETSARLEALMRWSQRRKRVASEVRDVSRRGAKQALALAEIQRRLAPGEVLVDYLVFDSVAAAVVVTRSAGEVVSLPLTPAEIARAIAELRAPFVSAYMGRLDLSRSRFDSRRSHDLYRALIQPLEHAFAGAWKLAIVPDGELHLLPFDALLAGRPAPAGEPGVAEQMIDRYEITYFPSASLVAPQASVAGITRRGTASGRLLLVAQKVPGGDNERKLIAATWAATGGRVTVLADHAATESAVAAHLGRFDIVHFATHAVANMNDPLASMLRLRSDESSDGALHLREIERLRTRASLVVLSACETHEGPLLAGAGPIGLAHAFIGSGAAAVVATLWPVGASTAELMDVFYREMARGRAPSRALRAAKLSTRARPETSNPFHWAAFVLVRGRAAP